MMYYVIKIALSAILIVIISELGKRHSVLAAVVASVPLVSVLAMVWLYLETRNVAQVADLASSIFWLVLPSLILFIAFPMLLRWGWGFFLSLGVSIALTTAGYLLMLQLLGHGVKSSNM
jgi:hypothetical protein